MLPLENEVGVSVIISDSTLRDGNHAIRHQLSLKQVCGYAAAAEKAGIDIVEVGHGNGLGGSSSLLGFSAVSDREMLEAARAQLVRSLLGVHFIPGLGKSADIAMALDIGVDIVRVASHCTEANITARFIEQTRTAGKTAYGVLMMAHMASPEKLLEQAKLMEDYGAHAVIIMDSAGYSSPNMVRERIGLLSNHLNIQVGFHGHNNLSVAVANTLVAVEAGASIVDGCIRGFGAGAGNTQLEPLVAILERSGVAVSTSFERMIELVKDADKLLQPETPHIQISNIASGLYGLFSGYVPHVQRAARKFAVSEFELYKRLAERNLVAGQEDVIIEEASRLATDNILDKMTRSSDTPEPLEVSLLSTHR
ncbi:4-hydroxy-2-oxovalerate aldolase [Pseudomonas fluorescens]|uniref:4-hydroxy-2-oxovalerate aldolase n=1 Tax=Pseudomonas fluorescens TaxID=294 RepID=A0A5E7SSM1_PSEFL|nr:4-hydroxy-2-oxovalerate aldolase [Pseudomonas fluorescens]VVP89010.1 4-hydroxy-2-oxovalerate aldolase [Pseudomonas fluorescens]